MVKISPILMALAMAEGMRIPRYRMNPKVFGSEHLQVEPRTKESKVFYLKKAEEKRQRKRSKMISLRA